MNRLARILICSAGLWLAASPLVFADDEDDAKSRREAAKEERAAKAAARRAAREARRGGKDGEAAADEGEPAPVVLKGDFGKELTALGEAAAMLAEVKDEETAKKTADKLSKTFSALPPLLHGRESELETLAQAQNKVSKQMERLQPMPFFESAGLQEAWTLMTDHFSRRSAERRRGR